MFTKELMEGMRNYVKWCEIEPGDKIMVLSPMLPPDRMTNLCRP